MVNFQQSAFGRNALIENLQTLANFQVGAVTPLQRENLDIIIHFLFDDTRIADDTFSILGIILVDMEEVQIIRELIKSLETLMGDFDLDDVEGYVGSRQWMTVVTTALATLDMTKRKNP